MCVDNSSIRSNFSAILQSFRSWIPGQSPRSSAHTSNPTHPTSEEEEDDEAIQEERKKNFQARRTAKNRKLVQREVKRKFTKTSERVTPKSRNRKKEIEIQKEVAESTNDRTDHLGSDIVLVETVNDISIQPTKNKSIEEIKKCAAIFKPHVYEDQTPPTSSVERLTATDEPHHERIRKISIRAKLKELPEKPNVQRLAENKTNQTDDDKTGMMDNETNDTVLDAGFDIINDTGLDTGFDTKQLLYEKTTPLTFSDISIIDVEPQAVNIPNNDEDSSVTTDSSSRLSIKELEVEIIVEPPPPTKKRQPPAVPPNKPLIRTFSNCSGSSVNSMTSIDGWSRNTSRVNENSRLSRRVYDQMSLSVSSVNSDFPLAPNPADFLSAFSLPHPNIPIFADCSVSAPNLSAPTDEKNQLMTNSAPSDDKNAFIPSEKSSPYVSQKDDKIVTTLEGFEPKLFESNNENHVKIKSKSESRENGASIIPFDLIMLQLALKLSILDKMA